MSRFLLFIISMAHFSIPNSILMSWLYILTARIRVYNSFSLLANSLISPIHIRWLIFSYDLLNLYLAAHFLSMWLRDIIGITNCSGDCAFHWNIPIWIFTLAMLFLPAINSTRQVFMVFRLISCTFWGSLSSSSMGQYMPFCCQSRL